MNRKQDVDGRRVKIGDTVRVIGVPNLSDMAEECRKETECVFQYLVGKTKRIRNFNELGMAELNFR